MSQVPLPELSRQARLEGHRKALELRQHRARIKAWLREQPEAALRRFQYVWTFPAAQGMKVYDLLTALPYIGPVKADALLLAAGISQGKGELARADRRKTVRACGPKQTERLFVALLGK